MGELSGIYLMFSFDTASRDLFINGVHPGPQVAALAEATLRGGKLPSYAVDFTRPTPEACDELEDWLKVACATQAEIDQFTETIVREIDRIKAEYEAGEG